MDLKGFLAEDEAQALYDHALEASKLGPVLEIGSYCGKSTIYLGLACQQNNRTVGTASSAKRSSIAICSFVARDRSMMTRG